MAMTLCMRILFIVLLGCALQPSAVSAQSYSRAVGLRFSNGESLAFSYVERLGKKFTLEGILEAKTRSEFYKISLMPTFHQPLLTKHFNVYYGPGIHYGFYNLPSEFEDPYGFSGLIGAELTIGRVNVSYDIKADVNIIGGDRMVLPSTNIALRYAFPRKKKKRFFLW